MLPDNSELSCVQLQQNIAESLYPGAGWSASDVGVVIGTYAAVPHVHLQLETAKRLYPASRILVHDDSSPAAVKLKALCAHYGAEFVSTPFKRDHGPGDMAAFDTGLRWAKNLGLKYLIKLSRRFVPLKDIVGDLLATAEKLPNATYTACDSQFNFRFRSECVGMDVDKWMPVADGLKTLSEKKNGGWLPEDAIHALARSIHTSDMLDGRPAEKRSTRNADKYALWEFMSEARNIFNGNYLWHTAVDVARYVERARELGLPYDRGDFLNPNAAYATPDQLKVMTLRGMDDAARYGTDKQSMHGYLPTYDELLAPYRGRSGTVVELGIDRGGSLRLWQDYFQNAAIVGLDIDARKLINAGRIRSLRCDSASPESMAAAAGQLGDGVFLVVDDGSHRTDHQVTAFNALFPILQKDGLYVIEDFVRSSVKVYDGLAAAYAAQIARYSIMDLVYGDEGRRNPHKDSMLAVFHKIA